MHLDNSCCNLASLNLLTFLGDDDAFDAARFAELGRADHHGDGHLHLLRRLPDRARSPRPPAHFRQLGIGYANLGALLMATGHAYDSEGGRSLAAAITSLMTGAAYKRSAELAGVVGPYDGYARNAEAHQRVMRKHAAANDDVRTLPASSDPQARDRRLGRHCSRSARKNGWRNAQASVLAPTGCLTADTLITTDRGLARLGEIGDVCR